MFLLALAISIHVWQKSCTGLQAIFFLCEVSGEGEEHGFNSSISLSSASSTEDLLLGWRGTQCWGRHFNSRLAVSTRVWPFWLAFGHFDSHLDVSSRVWPFQLAFCHFDSRFAILTRVLPF